MSSESVSESWLANKLVLSFGGAACFGKGFLMGGAESESESA